jgi:hypothetical protein
MRDAVLENLSATIWRCKVAISLREMSRTIGMLSGSRAPSSLHVGESRLLISTERDGCSVGASLDSLDGFQTPPGGSSATVQFSVVTLTVIVNLSFPSAAGAVARCFHVVITTKQTASERCAAPSPSSFVPHHAANAAT